MSEQLTQAINLLKQLSASETRTLYELAMTRTFKLEGEAKAEALKLMNA